MIRLTQRHDHYHGEIQDRLILPFELRQKSRFKSATEQGNPVGIVIERGHIIRDRQVLTDGNGHAIEVIAADEPVITAYADTPIQFARATYHLGNRHVPLQIGEQWIRFQPDHVLQEMVEMLGLSTRAEEAPFEPEDGAYHGHGHHH